MFLAIPITAERGIGIEEPPCGVCFHCGKASHRNKELPLSWMLTVCYTHWTSRAQRKRLSNFVKHGK